MPPIKNEEKDYPLTNAEKKILDWIKKELTGQCSFANRKKITQGNSFVEHVQPMLELNCVACHYEGKVI